MTGSTTCNPQQIDEYKRIEEQQMLAYQKAIADGASEEIKTEAENLVVASILNRNNAIKNCLNEIAALENAQGGIDLADSQATQLSGVAEEQRNRAVKEFQKLMATRDNKNRIIEINTDFSKRYDAYGEVFKFIFAACIPLLILGYMNKQGMLPDLVYFRVSVLIIVFTMFYSANIILDIYSRSNMNFDKYEWNDAGLKEDSLRDIKSNYNKSRGINIGGVSLLKQGEKTGDPSSYCGSGTTWCPGELKCRVTCGSVGSDTPPPPPPPDSSDITPQEATAAAAGGITPEQAIAAAAAAAGITPEQASAAAAAAGVTPEKAVTAYTAAGITPQQAASGSGITPEQATAAATAAGITPQQASTIIDIVTTASSTPASSTPAS